jgi:membrane protein implicated in regulation of membrane protease activity
VKRQWIVYILARLGVFALVLAAMLLIGFDWLYSTLIAAALSLAFSLIFLNRQREALSEDLYNKVKKNKTEGITDTDSDLENDLLDR